MAKGSVLAGVTHKALEENGLTIWGNYSSYKDSGIGWLSISTRKREWKAESINCQLETNCEIQKVSLIAYKETFISYSERTEKAQNQARDLIIKVAELYWELNPLRGRSSLPRSGPWLRKNRNLAHEVRTSGLMTWKVLNHQIPLNPLSLRSPPLPIKK